MLGKQAFFYLAYIYAFQSCVNGAPLMFPLTLGGFTGNTDIQSILVTSQQKILIAAITSDSSIVDTSVNSVGNFLAYFDYPSSKDYLWFKQYSSSVILQSFVENMDVNADLTQGCVLYSSFNSGGGVGYYDLLFFNLANGVFARQFRAYTSDFDMDQYGMLYYYNTKVYFFVYDRDFDKISFQIWNEADIPSINIGSTLSFSKIWDTNKFQNFGFEKGSIAQNYIVISTLDVNSNLAVIFMLEPETLVGPYNTFNILWTQSVLDMGGVVIQMDLYETNPNNRYIFGCGDQNGDSNSVWLFRMLSVNKAEPSGTFPEQYRLVRIQSTSTSSIWTCSDTKAISQTQFIVSVYQKTSPNFAVLIYQVTLDDSGSPAAHLYNRQTLSLSTSISTGFLTAKIIDWTRILIVENSIYNANNAVTGFSITPFGSLPIIKTTLQAESIIPVSLSNLVNEPLSELAFNPSSLSVKSTSQLGGQCSVRSVIATMLPIQPASVYNNQDTCLMPYGSYSSKSVTYYATDTTMTDDLGVSLTSYFSSCNAGTCATERLEVSSGNPVPTLTLGISNGIMSVSTSDFSLVGNTYSIYYRAVPPAGSFTNCVYYTQVRSLLIDQMTISTTGVSNINYNFYSGPTTVALSAFKQSTTSSLPQFAIVYTLRDQSSGLVYSDPSLIQSQFIVSFTSTGTPSVTINSNIYSQIGSYKMILEARFASYNPTYFVQSTFQIKIANTCSKTVITPNTNTTFYQLVGSGPIEYTILPLWTDSYNGACGAIQYSIQNALPSIMAFSSVKNAITVNPLVVGDAGSYQVKVQGKIVDQSNPSNTLSSTTNQVKFIVISTSITYLTPQTINNIYYYVGDPLLKVTLNQFLNSDSSYSVLYNLTTSSNTALDSSLIGTTPGVSNPYFEIYTSVLSKAGTYGIKLIGYYNIPIAYNNSIQFNVIVLNRCVVNLIQSSSLLPLTYVVGSTQLLSTFNSWSMNQTQCGPILKYEIKLQSGLPLPPFLSFDGTQRLIKVQTSDAQYTGSYQFIVQGLTKYYSPSSISTSQFDLKIECNVKTITRLSPSTAWIAQIGTFTSQSFDFGKISFDPDCAKYDPQTQIVYEPSMGSAPLPSYLTYDINNNQFVIQASSSMNPGPVGLNLKVTVMKGTIQILTTSFTQNLVINPQSALTQLNALPSVPKELLSSINLPTITLICKVGETKEYTSPDFSPKLSNGEHYSLENPKQLSFVSLSQQVLKIKPGESNQGLRYRVFLKATDEQTGERYLQTINIEVESTLVRLLKPLTAEIVQISRTGLVDVKFSQVMMVPINLTQLDDTYLALRVKDSEQKVRKDVNFTWNVTSYKGSQMQIKIYFQDPLKLSIETSDWLEIEVIQNALLMSIESSEFINITHKMRKKIPTQLDPGSQFLDSMSQSLKDKLSSLMSNSAGSATTAFLLNRIWGMVNSVQIVMLLPLGDVRLPANIHLTTQSIQSNTQHEILKALSFDNFEFTNTTPFSKEFQEQGYDSFYVIDNLRPIYKNINMFSMLTCLILLIAGCVKLIFKREIKLFETVKNLIVFNFLIKLIIENSLQLSVFSLVNLQESLPTSKNEIMSMAFAAVYLLLVVSLCLFNWLKVRKLTQNECDSIIVDNPTIAVLYQLLDRFNKPCLNYFSVFIARRIVTSLVYVTLKDHQEFQMHLQLLITLAMIWYLTKHPPYDSRALNIIELTNEWVVLACQYCMMTFMFELDSDALRNKLGLGFSILVIIQLVASFIALLLTKIIKAWPAVRQVIMKIRIFIKQKCAQRKATKEQQEQEKEDFSDLNKVEEEGKNNRRSEELLETEEQLVNGKQRKEKDGPDPEKFGRIDLDSAMPHYLDEIEAPLKPINQFEQTTAYTNYAEWAKNPGIRINQPKNPNLEVDYSEQFFGKNIFNQSSSVLIQQQMQTNKPNIDADHARILKEYNLFQKQSETQNNQQEAQNVYKRVNEALEYFTSQNRQITDPRKPFSKQ